MRAPICRISVRFLLSVVMASGLVAGLVRCAIASEPAVATTIKAPSTLSPLVTGNGFGYAVLSPNGMITKLYAHPYRFERPNADVSKDGYDTANLVRLLVGRSCEATDPSRIVHPPSTDYLSESHVLAVRSSGCENFYFMPFGLAHNALVLVRKELSKKDSKDDAFALAWEHGRGTKTEKMICGRTIDLTSWPNVHEQVALVPLDGDVKAEYRNDGAFLHGRAWALVVLERPEQLEKAVEDILAWKGTLNPDQLVDRELKDFEAWRVKPPVTFASENECKVWRQNEAILRMAQIREENTPTRINHGLILASLPDGVWFTPWVRDMSYAVVALTQMGHQTEAREALLSWFNARPVGLWSKETRNMDYQISVVRYYGDGSEEADYSGLQTPNVEFDDWGLALWAVSEYVKQTHDVGLLSAPTYRGTVYESMRDFVVKPLLGNLDPFQNGLIVGQDSSLWEEHQQNKKHYACSTIAAIPGLRGFKSLASEMKDEAMVNLVAEKLKLLEIGFNEAYLHDGALRGSVEPSFKNEIDGALVEALNNDLVKDPAIVKCTLDKLELLKMASGGYRRTRGDTAYEAHEFLFVDFNLCRFYFKSGDRARAQQLLTRMVDKSCADHCLIPEMYVSKEGTEFKGVIGDPTGSTPMVGFGAGDYVMTLIEREHAAPSKLLTTKE